MVTVLGCIEEPDALVAAIADIAKAVSPVVFATTSGMLQRATMPTRASPACRCLGTWRSPTSSAPAPSVRVSTAVLREV
jgi:hypothetical protein